MTVLACNNNTEYAEASMVLSTVGVFVNTSPASELITAVDFGLNLGPVFFVGD